MMEHKQTNEEKENKKSTVNWKTLSVTRKQKKLNILKV